MAPCEVVILDDPDLSRRHARIFWNGSVWMLEDLNSRNGTFFRVGLTRLRLGSATDERVATAAASANATRI